MPPRACRTNLGLIVLLVSRLLGSVVRVVRVAVIFIEKSSPILTEQLESGVHAGS